LSGDDWGIDEWEDTSQSVSMVRALMPNLPSSNVRYSTTTAPATYTAASSISTGANA